MTDWGWRHPPGGRPRENGPADDEYDPPDKFCHHCGRRIARGTWCEECADCLDRLRKEGA